MTTIQIGDRVTWQPRGRGKFAAWRTGIVREIKRTTDDSYAVVEAEPDGAWHFPSVEKLVRVEEGETKS